MPADLTWPLLWANVLDPVVPLGGLLEDVRAIDTRTPERSGAEVLERCRPGRLLRFSLEPTACVETVPR